MPAKIPSMQLTGSHTCDKCGRKTGPHYRHGKQTLCFRCEVDRLADEVNVTVVLLGVVIALAGLTALVLFLMG